MSAFFVRENGLYHPQGAALAPGASSQLNRAAVAGLLANEIELTPTLTPLKLARLTIEAQQPAPAAPARLRSRLLRDGKRLQLVIAELVVGEDAVASALGLRVCEGASPVDAPAGRALADPRNAPREARTRPLGPAHPLATLAAEPDGADFAFWSCCEAELVAGEPLSGAARAVMASGLAASRPGEQAEPASSGVDLSLYLARQPEGAWILSDGEDERRSPGFRLVSLQLSDLRGPFGYAHETVMDGSFTPDPGGRGRRG